MSHVSHNLATLLKLLDNDPLAAAKKCKLALQVSEKSHNEQLYDTIAFLTAQTRKLASSEQDRAAFFNEDFWRKRPNVTSEKKAIRLAVCYMLGAKQSKGALYEQARSYAEAVILFNEQKVDPLAIPDILKRKPLYALLGKGEAKIHFESTRAKPCSSKVRAKLTKGDPGRREKISGDPVGKPKQTMDNIEETPNQRRPSEFANSIQALRKAFNPQTDIFFDAAQYHSEILELPIGTIFKLRCRRIDRCEGVQKFKIVYFKHRP